MSKRQFKAQASSSSAFSGQSPLSKPFGSSGAAFGGASSPLSYLAEQPDLSALSDPNAVVSFKNLSKRDGVTKAKALEELQAYISSLVEKQDSPEEAFLEAWIKVYPRLSIDSFRRVRQLAHTLHGSISVSSGKRIARFMPQVVGPWLAGVHDADKSVMRSAQGALKAVFPTAEKLQSINKLYQAPILHYSLDALLKETPKTLSDERVTTQEDSDAKYSRVVSSSLLVVTDLLENLSHVEVDKQRNTYNDLVASEIVWNLILSEDTSVRRSVFKFLKTCVSKLNDSVKENIDIITAAMLSKQALSHQSGSSLSYSDALLTLSLAFPMIWTIRLVGKGSTLSRLQSIFKAGSQGAAPEFWNNLAVIFNNLPDEALPLELSEASKTLAALHTGILKKDEPRTNTENAWNCYFSVADRLYSKLSVESQQKLFFEAEFPLTQQYLSPNPEDSQWSISGPRAVVVAAHAISHGARHGFLESEWPKTATRLLESIETLLPEQSKDYEESQKAVILHGERWFTLQAETIKLGPKIILTPIFQVSLVNVLSGAIKLLIARNGKPYGAAGVLEASVRLCGAWLLHDSEIADLLSSFALHDLPSLLFSPSCSFLVSLLYRLQDMPCFDEAWQSSLDSVMKRKDSVSIVKPLQNLLASPQAPPDFAMATENTVLQSFLSEHIHNAVAGRENWSFLAQIMGQSSDVFSEQTTQQMLVEMTQSLTIQESATNALAGLDIVSSSSTFKMSKFLASPDGSNLLQRLLLLTESPDDEVARQASDINHKIESAVAKDDQGATSTKSILDVIHGELNHVAADSLSVDTLVDLACRLVASSGEGKEAEVVAQVLPDIDVWTAALKPLLAVRPHSQLSITNPLRGAVFLVASDAEAPMVVSPVLRDQAGNSQAIRIADYCVKLFKACGAGAVRDDSVRVGVYVNLALTIQLCNDKLGIAASNELWLRNSVDVENDMVDFISEAHSLLNSWSITSHSSSQSETTQELTPLVQQQLWSASAGLSSSSFHHARAFATVVSEDIEASGWHRESIIDHESKVKEFRKSPDLLRYAAFLIAYEAPLSTSQSITRTCNELIADLTGLDIDKNCQTGLRQLIFLNLILTTQDQTIETVAKQRLIFFVKHIVSWLKESAVDHATKSEICKALSNLLPSIMDLYGTHWSEILGFLVAFWAESDLIDLSPSSAKVSLLYSSLRLVWSLRKLVTDEDSNDDLQDAWTECRDDLASGLVNILKQSGPLSDHFNQPLKMMNDLLSRELHRIPLNRTLDLAEMCPLVSSESEAVQRTTFAILHDQIPKRQEEVSLNAALDKTTVRLPAELLSLIVSTPSFALADGSFDLAMPLPIRAYLHSWVLIFDHFKNASDKVKADYAQQLKEEGDYLDSLLNFVATILNLASPKPIDASKFDVTTFDFTTDDSPIKDTQWLVAHLYYLTLANVPSLSRDWWRATPRQLTKPVEIWTEKYFSQHLISAALDIVAKWAEAQDTTSDDALLVKPNARTKSISVSREIDDQMLTMMITLPSNLPLGEVAVDSVSRVAIDEKKWNNWLRITKGVIKFSDNSVVDGLVAFRKNVNGALKGQSECAICYSIVSSDKQLPTKRCGTCRNLFHGSCLYKWFKTSNSSSCPLCRNPFNYT